jgi:anti-anti-sigma factor
MLDAEAPARRPSTRGGQVNGRLDMQVHRPRGGVTLVQVIGDVSAGSVPALARLLADAVLPPGAPRIVLDLAGVTSWSPEGVAVLLTVEEQVRAGGGSVELLAPSPDLVIGLHEAATRA